jgi:head-tail adaptor
MPLDVGLMDREIVLQTATKSQDADTGEELLTWDAGDTVFAQWLPAGTSEAWQAQQRIEAYVDGVLRIHDRDTRPTPDATRIVWDGKIFDVKGVVEIQRGEGLDLVVVARP